MLTDRTKSAFYECIIIALRVKAAVKWISGKLVDQWIDGEVKNRVKKRPWP